MKSLKQLALLFGMGALQLLVAQDSPSTPIPSESKDSIMEYRRVSTILETTGQLDDQTVADVEAKLKAHRSSPTDSTWAAYIYNLKVPDTLQKEGVELLKKLKNNGAHVLGDFYLEQAKYQEALAYYKEAVAHPYCSFGTTNEIEDEISTTIKLITCFEKLGQTDDVFVTGLSRLLSNVHLGKGTVLEEQLIRMAAKEKKAIKKNIDDGLKKVSALKVENNFFGEIVEEQFFAFLFMGKKIKVLYSGGDSGAFMKGVRQTAFYKSLEVE